MLSPPNPPLSDPVPTTTCLLGEAVQEYVEDLNLPDSDVEFSVCRCPSTAVIFHAHRSCGSEDNER
jgi:hypothetical protein